MARPASVTATAPASTTSPNSVRCSPLRPADTAAAGKTRTPPARNPSATTKPTEAGSSTTGSVSGMQHTAV